MQCVILAAGRGTRMGYLCENCPKPMLPILGKPKLEYTIEQLPEFVDEVIVVIGYLGEQIRSYFGEYFSGRRMRYVQQTELDGTGGAVHLTKSMVRGKFFVLMGDDLYRREDLERLAQHELSVLAYEVENASAYAVLELDNCGRLIAIQEVPHTSSSCLVNTAAYVLNELFFARPLVPKSLNSSEYGLPQTLAKMAGEHDVFVEKATTWFPIGTPEALEEANEKILFFQ